MSRGLAIFVAVLLSLAAGIGAGGGAAAQTEGPVVGVVSRVRAAAAILSPGMTPGVAAAALMRPAEPGAAVRRGESLRTGPGARLEVTLNDGTVVTLGESAVMAVDDFVFDLQAQSGTARLSLLSGVFRFVTGRIGALPRHDLEVRGAVATIGIRGTDVWGGPIDGPFSVFLLSGRVEVTTAAGAAVLDAPGQGVAVPAADQPPDPVIVWGAEKVARAVATVSF